MFLYSDGSISQEVLFNLVGTTVLHTGCSLVNLECSPRQPLCCFGVPNRIHSLMKIRSHSTAEYNGGFGPPMGNPGLTPAWCRI